MIKKLTIPVSMMRPSVFAELIDTYEEAMAGGPYPPVADPHRGLTPRELAGQLRRLREARAQEYGT